MRGRPVRPAPREALQRALSCRWDVKDGWKFIVMGPRENIALWRSQKQVERRGADRGPLVSGGDRPLSRRYRAAVLAIKEASP